MSFYKGKKLSSDAIQKLDGHDILWQKLSDFFRKKKSTPENTDDFIELMISKEQQMLSKFSKGYTDVVEALCSVNKANRFPDRIDLDAVIEHCVDINKDFELTNNLKVLDRFMQFFHKIPDEKVREYLYKLYSIDSHDLYLNIKEKYASESWFKSADSILTGHLNCYVFENYDVLMSLTYAHTYQVGYVYTYNMNLFKDNCILVKMIESGMPVEDVYLVGMILTKTDLVSPKFAAKYFQIGKSFDVSKFMEEQTSFSTTMEKKLSEDFFDGKLFAQYHIPIKGFSNVSKDLFEKVKELGCNIDVRGTESRFLQVEKINSLMLYVSTSRYPFTRFEWVDDAFQIASPNTNNKYAIQLIIKGNGTVLKQNTPTCRIPAQLSDIIKQVIICPEIEPVWDIWFEMWEKRNPFVMELHKIFSKSVREKKYCLDKIHTVYAKDVMDSIKLLKVDLGKAVLAKNWNDYFHMFKNADRMNVNFAKIPVDLAAMAVSCIRYIDPSQYTKYGALIHDAAKRKYFKDFDLKHEVSFFIKLLWNQLFDTEVDDSVPYIIKDYVIMSLRLHEKITMTAKSYKTIVDLHDELDNKYKHSNASKAMIPKKSIFNQLRKKLPSAFEWLKDTKRFIEESDIQHNCVWSYIPDANDDKCAIYSYFNIATNTRYTIEFVAKNQNGLIEYQAVQIQMDRNSGADHFIVHEIYKALGRFAVIGYLNYLDNSYKTTSDYTLTENVQNDVPQDATLEIPVGAELNTNILPFNCQNVNDMEALAF